MTQDARIDLTPDRAHFRVSLATGALTDDDLDVLVPLRQEFAAVANGGDPYKTAK